MTRNVFDGSRDRRKMTNEEFTEGDEGREKSGKTDRRR